MPLLLAAPKDRFSRVEAHMALPWKMDMNGSDKPHVDSETVTKYCAIFFIFCVKILCCIYAKIVIKQNFQCSNVCQVPWDILKTMNV